MAEGNAMIFTGTDRRPARLMGEFLALALDVRGESRTAAELRRLATAATGLDHYDDDAAAESEESQGGAGATLPAGTPPPPIVAPGQQYPSLTPQPQERPRRGRRATKRP